MNMIKIFLFTLILAFSLSTHADVDPLKNINEKTHNLNEALDLQLASPVARLYKRITPDFAEIGITNFTRNLEDLSISLNNILQGKVDDGFSDLIRFVVNSTLGLGGFVDVASQLGFDKHDEDFGQTLAVWGVSDGP